MVLHTQEFGYLFLKVSRLVFGLLDKLVTKEIVYHLFDVVVEFHKFVFYYTF